MTLLPVRLSLCVSLLFLCGGCSLLQSPVPANHITIKTPMGSYDIQTPKNVTINKFAATVTSNGVVTVNFDNWSATNDPLVIDKASAGQVSVINAWSGLLNSAVYSAANGAVAGATKP